MHGREKEGRSTTDRKLFRDRKAIRRGTEKAIKRSTCRRERKQIVRLTELD